MTRRDWLLSTLAIAARTVAAAPTKSLPVDAVVLDLSTVGNDAPGSRNAVFEQGSVHTAALPGSTLKPLILAALLERKLLKPDERLTCPGGFHLAGHNLECSHIHPAPAFDAVDALAASCNYWFATMARRLGAAGVRDVLRHYGLAAQLAPNLDQAGLQALGLARVSATPWTLGLAYEKLYRSGPPTLVADGLRAAVERGTGQRALSGRVSIVGKTGTAHGERPGTTVGWFAGWAYPVDRNGARPAAEIPQTPAGKFSGIVFAVRVPGGTGGGEAADQARSLAERWASGRLH